MKRLTRFIQPELWGVVEYVYSAVEYINEIGKLQLDDKNVFRMFTYVTSYENFSAPFIILHTLFQGVSMLFFESTYSFVLQCSLFPMS